MPVIHQITHRVPGKRELFQIVRTYSPELNRIAAPVAQLAIFHLKVAAAVDNSRRGTSSISGTAWAGGMRK
jgi:hypothetical protein